MKNNLLYTPVYKTILTPGIFFITLSSYYFYSISVAPFPIFGAVLIGLLAFHTKINQKDIQGIKISLMLVNSLVVLSIAYCLSFGIYPDVKRIIGYFLVLVTGVLVFFAVEKKDVASILSQVILIHLTFFYIQFFTFYLLGTKIDFLEPITGEAQRTYFDEIELPIFSTIFRTCGLYNEPGTYANHLALLTALFACFKSVSTKNKIIFYSAIISIILSFSVFGIIFAALILLAEKGRKSLDLLLFLLSLSVVYKYIDYRFFEKPESGLDSGLGIREDFFSTVMNMFIENPILFFFGVGFFNTSIEDKINFAVNDLGLLFYIFYAGGFISLCTITFFLGVVFIKSKKHQRLFLIILGLSKISIYTLYFSSVLAIFIKLTEANIDVRNKRY